MLNSLSISKLVWFLSLDWTLTDTSWNQKIFQLLPIPSPVGPGMVPEFLLRCSHWQAPFLSLNSPVGPCHPSCGIFMLLIQRLSSGCYDKIPQTGWWNNKLSFLTVLKARKPKNKVLQCLISGEGLFPWLQMATFLVYPHMVDKEQASSLLSLLIRALVPSQSLI